MERGSERQVVKKRQRVSAILTPSKGYPQWEKEEYSKVWSTTATLPRDRISARLARIVQGWCPSVSAPAQPIPGRLGSWILRVVPWCCTGGPTIPKRSRDDFGPPLPSPEVLDHTITTHHGARTRKRRRGQPFAVHGWGVLLRGEW